MKTEALQKRKNKHRLADVWTKSQTPDIPWRNSPMLEEDEVLTRQRCDQTKETRSPEQNLFQGRTGFLWLIHHNSSIIIIQNNGLQY